MRKSAKLRQADRRASSDPVETGRYGDPGRAARLLVESAARAYDLGERCDMEAGMAKLFATGTVHNSLEAMRLHGTYGYAKEFNIERYYRDAPCWPSAKAPTSCNA